jgi:hypothetical protein
VGTSVCGTVEAGAVEATVAADVADVAATVAVAGVVDAVAGVDVPGELEHATSTTGPASHSNRALARFMMANSTMSAADALVIERGPVPLVSLQEIARVDDRSTCHGLGDLRHLEPAELIPFGENGQHVCALAR